MAKDKDVEPINGKIEKVKLEDLHIRYIPMAKLENWWDGHKNGCDMMSLATSPHVEIMRIFRDYGFDWKRLKHTKYTEERRFRAKVGMTQWKSKEYMKTHLKKRMSIFTSLKKHGYKAKLHKNRPIAVLKEPFWNSRFALINPLIKGYELWNGAGRSSAAYVLGFGEVPAVFYRDKYSGTMKCKDLEDRFVKSV